jgi:hypothetical protein
MAENLANNLGSLAQIHRKRLVSALEAEEGDLENVLNAVEEKNGEDAMAHRVCMVQQDTPLDCAMDMGCDEEAAKQEVLEKESTLTSEAHYDLTSNWDCDRFDVHCRLILLGPYEKRVSLTHLLEGRDAK